MASQDACNVDIQQCGEDPARFDFNRRTTNLENAHDVNIYKYIIRDDSSPSSSESASNGQGKSMWTRDLEELAYSWGQKAVGFRQMHNMAADMNTFWFHALGIPAVILSAVAGTTAFATSECPAHANISPKAVAIGAISIAVSALTSLQNFMQFSRKAEQHKQAGHRYGAFYREIDAELSKQRKYRNNPFEFIQLCRLTLDSMVSQGPSIPSRISKEYKSKFKKHPHKGEPFVEMSPGEGDSEMRSHMQGGRRDGNDS